MWTRSLVFIIINTPCGDSGSVNPPSDPGRTFSHMRKAKVCSVREDACVCSKVFQ